MWQYIFTRFLYILAFPKNIIRDLNIFIVVAATLIGAKVHFSAEIISRVFSTHKPKEQTVTMWSTVINIGISTMKYRHKN